MCGIAGVFHDDPNRPVDADRVRAMAATLVHRGPDGEGVEVGSGWGLGHRRLSIVDIAGGAQPMATADRALVVVFNGEIYNHLDLRAELEAAGHAFRTRCDTEVLLHGYRQWGDGLAERLRGMFAFAIVDVARRRLYAARDRVGKKPFHYARHDGSLLFGSELKALLAYGGLPRTLDAQALAKFLCLRYVPDPATIFEGIHKLPPAHCLVAEGGTLRTWRYWTLSFAEVDPRPAEELYEAVLDRLDEAVRIRLMGEVPLAPFLSAGIDSYAVVESMTRSSGGPVRACTIGFDDPAFDERDGARMSARACGAELFEGVVHVADLLEVGWHADAFDEPFADASAIPTYHVSRLARQHVTVALSGDGGDESFAGYRRYVFDRHEHRARPLLPRALWRLFGSIYPKADWLPRYLRFKRTFQNLALDPDEAYARSVSASLPDEVRPLLRPPFRDAADTALSPVREAWRAADGNDPLSRAAAADFATWLPGDILTKVDRASMAVSLEVRAPFLDHELVELAARIPASMKAAGGETKAFLRRALAGRLDADALARPKRGFAVPLSTWFRGPSGDALERVLDAPGMLGEILDTDVLRSRLRAHRARTRNHAEILWASLVLSRFLKRWVE